MTKAERADYAISRIRQVLEDDKNYQDATLKLGGIWSLCVRAAEYRIGESTDGQPFVEVKLRAASALETSVRHGLADEALSGIIASERAAIEGGTPPTGILTPVPEGE